MISKIDQDFIKNSCQELADSFVGQSVNLSAFTGSSFIFFITRKKLAHYKLCTK